jgi:hypothetical protein
MIAPFARHRFGACWFQIAVCPARTLNAVADSISPEDATN